MINLFLFLPSGQFQIGIWILQVIHGTELHQSFTTVVFYPNPILSHDTFILHVLISYLGIEVPHDDKEVVPYIGIIGPFCLCLRTI